MEKLELRIQSAKDEKIFSGVDDEKEVIQYIKDNPDHSFKLIVVVVKVDDPVPA